MCRLCLAGTNPPASSQPPNPSTARHCKHHSHLPIVFQGAHLFYLPTNPCIFDSVPVIIKLLPCHTTHSDLHRNFGYQLETCATFHILSMYDYRKHSTNANHECAEKIRYRTGENKKCTSSALIRESFLMKRDIANIDLLAHCRSYAVCECSRPANDDAHRSNLLRYLLLEHC